MKKELFLTLYEKINRMGLNPKLLTKDGIGKLKDSEIQYLIELECSPKVFEEILLLYGEPQFTEYIFYERKKMISLILNNYDKYVASSSENNYIRNIKYVSNVYCSEQRDFKTLLKLGEIVLLSKENFQAYYSTEVAKNIVAIASGKVKELAELIASAEKIFQAEYGSKVATDSQVIASGKVVELTAVVTKAVTTHQAVYGSAVARHLYALKDVVELAEIVTKSKNEFQALASYEAAGNPNTIASGKALELTELASTTENSDQAKCVNLLLEDRRVTSSGIILELANILVDATSSGKKKIKIDKTALLSRISNENKNKLFVSEVLDIITNRKNSVPSRMYCALTKKLAERSTVEKISVEVKPKETKLDNFWNAYSRNPESAVDALDDFIDEITAHTSVYVKD